MPTDLEGGDLILGLFDIILDLQRAASLEDDFVDVENEHDGHGGADDEVDVGGREGKQDASRQNGEPRKDLTTRGVRVRRKEGRGGLKK